MRCYRAHIAYEPSCDPGTVVINAKDSIERRAHIIVASLPIGLRQDIFDTFVATTKDVLEKYAILDSKAAAAAIRTSAKKKAK